jgi:hypothetical protein
MEEVRETRQCCEPIEPGGTAIGSGAGNQSPQFYNDTTFRADICGEGEETWDGR